MNTLSLGPVSQPGRCFVCPRNSDPVATKNVKPMRHKWRTRPVPQRALREQHRHEPREDPEAAAEDVDEQHGQILGSHMTFAATKIPNPMTMVRPSNIAAIAKFGAVRSLCWARR
jgi:hypothetical protein